MQLLGNSLPYKIPCRPWKVAGTDLFRVNNKTLLCIIDYYKFPIIKKVGGPVADNLIQTAKKIFAEYGQPKRWFQMQAQISLG